MRTGRLGFSGHESKQRELEEPTRRLSMTLKVPKAKTETLNCHAEVTTSAGKTLRSSAVLRLQQSKPRETRSGP